MTRSHTRQMHNAKRREYMKFARLGWVKKLDPSEVEVVGRDGKVKVKAPYAGTLYESMRREGLL